MSVLIDVHTRHTRGLMKNHKHMNLNILLAFIVTLSALQGCASYVASPYKELGDPRLQYIATARVGRSESVTVVFNSKICADIGDACGFFKNHAFAHDMLNHQIFTNPKYYTQTAESEADCWAGKYGKPVETLAAVELLEDVERRAELPITGDPDERAKLIKACALENDRWLGEI